MSVSSTFLRQFDETRPNWVKDPWQRWWIVFDPTERVLLIEPAEPSLVQLSYVEPVRIQPPA